MEIELSKISVRLPQRPRALFKIPELKISAGQRVLIQGASGRGKTTLLHLIAGLLLPDEGEVRVDGVSLSRLSEGERAQLRRQKMGLIFQRLNLLDYLTAVENVCLGIGRTSLENARSALNDVGLGDRCDERSSVLSLGEQQRVAVARALLMRPEVLLADEPTSSLDDANAENVLDLLIRASEGRTLILVSHDRRIADRFEAQYDFNIWVPQ